MEEVTVEGTIEAIGDLLKAAMEELSKENFEKVKKLLDAAKDETQLLRKKILGLVHNGDSHE